jgi:hypothetical protein
VTDFRCTINGLLGGVRPWSMRWYLTGGVTEAAMSATFNAAATALFSTAADGIQHLMCADVTTVNTKVATLSGSMTEVSQTLAAMALTGDAAGNSLPWDTAFLERYTFPGVKKSQRGFTHLPPMAQSTLVSHVMTPAVAESLQDVFDVFFPAIHTGGVQSFVFNGKNLKDGTVKHTKEIPTGYEISDKPGSVEARADKVLPTYYPGGAF